MSAWHWRRALVLLAALAVMALTFSLGRWQLGRAAEKLALQAAQQAREQQPALDAHALLTPDMQPPALAHRRVELQGQWLADRTVFLDNRSMDGQAGFFVLTPLRLNTSPAVVLVQRGWAPRNFLQREALPPVDTPAGDVRVQGRLAERPSARWALGQESTGQIRQNLDLDAFRAETGLPLLPLVVLQTGAASEGLRRDWPAPDSGVNTHYGYAFQWFGLCALMGLLLFWFQLVRPVLHRRSRH